MKANKNKLAAAKTLFNLDSDYACISLYSIIILILMSNGMQTVANVSQFTKRNSERNRAVIGSLKRSGLIIQNTKMTTGITVHYEVTEKAYRLLNSVGLKKCKSHDVLCAISEILTVMEQYIHDERLKTAPMVVLMMAFKVTNSRKELAQFFDSTISKIGSIERSILRTNLSEKGDDRSVISLTNSGMAVAKKLELIFDIC